jgi:Holliday junction resolvase-like predicted endonuclease
LRHVKPEIEPPEIIAGRQGEDFLKSIITSNLRYKGVHCFVGKRVPSTKHGCRFEIDLIVLTKKQLHIIEVKNWSGTLRYGDDGWLQVKRDGSEVLHRHLTQHNESKAVALLSYLSKHGINLPRGFTSQKVLFMNHNLKVDKVISKDRNVIQRWQLNQYLRTQKGANISERLLHSVIEDCLDAEHSKDVLNDVFNALPSETMDEAIQILKQLRTWDRVKLHGGRILQGDAIDILTRNQTIDMNSFPTDSKIKFCWTRGFFYSFIKIVLLGLAPGKLTHKLMPSYKLYPDYGKFNFHAVGDKQPLQLDIKRIDWISIG